MIKTIQDSIEGSEFKPRHTIEIYCPNCGRDVDEAELAAKKCNDCGTDLSEPEQHVAIVVANMSFGGSTLQEFIMNMQDLLKAIIPILVACIAWLLGQVSSFQTRLTQIESKMPALITNDGTPTDSPISAEKRHALKAELHREIQDLHVRVKLLEERGKK